MLTPKNKSPLKKKTLLSKNLGGYLEPKKPAIFFKLDRKGGGQPVAIPYATKNIELPVLQGGH